MCSFKELSNAIHEKAVLSESIEKIQIELNAALNAKDNVSNDLSKVTEVSDFLFKSIIVSSCINLCNWLFQHSA